ncbi:MAG TPA: SUF system Fe-S cluster assembly protein [Chitinophagaceae bacterium]|nr:SUF system Fe-S cluster assembly protein [Chitinophagaceae bacterium]
MDPQVLKQQVIDALKTVYDPEIPVDIFELGLIYGVNTDEQGNVEVIMTLTAPSCPSAGEIPFEVENKVRAVSGVNQVDVTLTFDPPWDKDKMSEEAKLELGFL